MGNLKSLPFIVLAVFFLEGCISQPPVPTNHYYRLADSPAVTPAPAKLLDGIVSVKRFKSGGLHNDRAILYGSSDRPLELRQYHYHFWAATPPRLVRDYLVQYLRSAGVADKVIAYSPALRADYIVNGRLRRFATILNGSESMVVVDMELALSKNNDRSIILVKDYSKTLPGGTGDMNAAVAAFSRALDEIYAEFLRDAKAAL